MTALSFIFWVVLGGAVGSLLVGIVTYTRYLIWLRKDHKNQKTYRDALEQQVFVEAGGIIVPPPTTTAQAAIQPVAARQVLPQLFESLNEKTEPLEETWSNEKIKAWRVITVIVEKGDPDGLWLGFPHPDGPTEDVVTPLRHLVGVELHAECRNRLLSNCHTIPGEQCASGYGSGCGFYAFKTREQAIEYLETELTFTSYLERAVAHVLLSGKVIEHENGYRAEILEVVSMEPAKPYRDSFSSAFSSVIGATGQASLAIGATTQAFNAYIYAFNKSTKLNLTDIVSGGV